MATPSHPRGRIRQDHQHTCQQNDGKVKQDGLDDQFHLPRQVYSWRMHADFARTISRVGSQIREQIWIHPGGLRPPHDTGMGLRCLATDQSSRATNRVIPLSLGCARRLEAHPVCTRNPPAARPTRPICEGDYIAHKPRTEMV